MRLLVAGLSALLLSALPALAATEINVSFAPEFEEKLEEDYGEREGERLADDVRKDLLRALEKEGVEPARIEVTLIDAKPNRPTFGQLSDRPGLDPIRSISIGGAKLSAVAYDASGNEIGSLEYKWYENNIRDVIGAGTWTDANRSFYFFSRKFARQLAGQ